MKKINRFSVLLLCFFTFVIIVLGCSTSPVGETDNKQDLEIVKLDLKIEKYNERQILLSYVPLEVKIYTIAVNSSEKVLEEIINIGSVENGNWVYEHDITNLYNKKTNIIYEISTKSDNYLNAKKEINHKVVVHANGFVSSYSVLFKLYPLNSYTHIPGTGTGDEGITLPEGETESVNIKFPDEAVPAGGLDVRITPINILASSSKSAPKGDFIAASKFFLNCQVGTVKNDVFTPFDHYEFNAPIEVTFTTTNGILRNYRAAKFYVGFYDEDEQSWTKEKVNATINGNKITANINHFSDVMPIMESDISYTKSDEIIEDAIPYITFNNCSSSTTLSGTRTYDLTLGAASTDPSNPVPAVILQYLELEERYDTSVELNYFLERYQYKSYFIKRHKIRYNVTYTDVNNVDKTYVIDDYQIYTISSELHVCHDQGAGE